MHCKDSAAQQHKDMGPNSQCEMSLALSSFMTYGCRNIRGYRGNCESTAAQSEHRQFNPHTMSYPNLITAQQSTRANVGERFLGGLQDAVRQKKTGTGCRSNPDNIIKPSTSSTIF